MAIQSPPLCAPADPAPNASSCIVPSGACDCHAHVFALPSDLVSARLYTPPPASLADYQKMLSVLGIERAVIVQPSVYGTDNRTTLEAVAEVGDAFRAVVVVDPSVAVAELKEMHAQGARGARVNALFSGSSERAVLLEIGQKLAQVGWHMQMLVDVSSFEDLEGFVDTLAVPVVFDHIGHVQAAKGLNDPGFTALLRLMESGKVWTKLSGSYRMTGQDHPPYTDVAPFARALVAANPEQCVWASDWPHPQIPVSMPNDGALLDMLVDWVPDTATRKRILVDNPAQLYGFEA
ncbi:amidohydrolase family protein [uncultured Roseobacter sp.]|uniref:amidohydrolase family protein n=1 Tax=uncultured Roseobacter sp. TaxID=114847 RepID=UPI00262435B8|nr:amidohydrolase family protein [uncultured Roseobacter sp.]